YAAQLFDVFGNVFVKLVRKGDLGTFDRVGDAHTGGGPVNDNDDPVYAQEGRARQLVGVDLGLDRLEEGQREETGEFAQGCPVEFFFDKPLGQTGDGLGGFQQQITVKTVAHHHVGLAGKHGLGLHVAHEVHV